METQPTHTPGPRSFRAATWAAAKAPRWLVDCAALSGGWTHYVLSHEKRRNYLGNTKALFDTGVPGRPWQAFQNQALNVIELLRTVRQSNGEILSRVTLHGREHIDAALMRGRGVILTTFHSGNWELAGLALSLAGYPITTVAGEQLRQGWSDSVKRLKERFGIRIVSPSDSSRTLSRDLEANRVIVLHLDGDVFSGGAPVPFLGKEIDVPKGPARLSRMMNSPIGFAYSRRRPDRRLDVFVEPLLSPVSNADEEIDVTRALVSRVEKCIAEEPQQWCIFRKL